MKVADAITWANSAAALRLHVLGSAVDTTHDAELQPLLETGVESADEYLERDFEGSIPKGVRFGVFEFCRARHQSEDQVDGTASATYEGRGESFEDHSQFARAMRSAEAAWYPHCKAPHTKRPPR